MHLVKSNLLNIADSTRPVRTRSQSKAPSFTEVDLFPPFEDIPDNAFYSIRLSNSTTDLTHGLHRFPAKFIPQIPKWALREFGGHGVTVLDPFMGSGTTLVEALNRPGYTVGIDIDPLARLISRAKTETVDVPHIVSLSTAIRSYWKRAPTFLEVPLSGVENFQHWFTREAWGELQTLRDVIASLDCTAAERRLLYAVFSSIIRRVSNADDQSQKTYVSHTRPKKPPRVGPTFWRALSRALSGLRSAALERHGDAVVEIPDDADALRTNIRDRSVQLIITSPPYLESVDYMYNAMLEYFWLGDVLGVRDRAALNELRRQQIGSRRPHGAAEIPDPLRAQMDLANLPSWRRSGTVAYFSKMHLHFAEAARCLDDGGRYVLVIGNSQTRLATLPVHDCLVRLAASCNLELEKAFGYRVRRHYMKFPRMGRGGIILLDWVIVLRKGNGAVSRPEPLPMPAFNLAADAVST